MTSPERYQDFLDDFGVSLRTAELEHRALRPAVARRPLVAVVGLAVAALIAGVVLGASPASRSVDVLGQAQAALAPGGELVHYVVRESDGPSVGRGLDVRVARDRCPRAGSVEVWHATDPARWRVVRPAIVRGDRCRAARGSDADHRLGRQHYAFADGTLTHYSPDANRVTVYREYGNGTTPEVPVVGLTDLESGGQEPLVTLRRMLADGMVVEERERSVNGRAVRTLSRTIERQMTIDSRGSERTVTWRDRAIYDVDAETFAPVRIVLSSGIPVVRSLPGGGLRVVGRRPTAIQLDIERYERSALTDAARGLLVVRPPDSAKVVETRSSAARDAVDRRRP